MMFWNRLFWIVLFLVIVGDGTVVVAQGNNTTTTPGNNGTTTPGNNGTTTPGNATMGGNATTAIRSVVDATGSDVGGTSPGGLPLIQDMLPLYDIVMNGRVNSRAQPCPSDPNITGYDTVTDLNVDIENEARRIARGEVVPLSEYFFVICPRMFLMVDREALLIQIPNTNFVCSIHGRYNDTCVFRGGTTQINVINSAEHMQSVTFRGVTFDEFTETAVKIDLTGDATIDPTIFRATFYDVAWKNFNGINLIQPNVPIRVDIQTAIIKDGFGKTLLPNQVGGIMNVNEILVEDTDATVVLRTSNSSQSSFSHATVEDVAIEEVAMTERNSQLTVSNVILRELRSIRYGFLAVTDSSMTIDTLDVVDIILDEDYSVVVARESSTVTVTDGNMIRNTGVQAGFAAFTGSSIDVEKYEFLDNRGIPGTSSLIYAESEGRVSSKLLSMDENTEFIGHFLAIDGGNIHLQSCCILSGRSVAIVFVSKDSAYTATVDNYVDPKVVSDICHERNNVGNRLTYEVRDPSVNTACFVTTFCETDCLPFDRISECGGEIPPTIAPTIPPPTISPRPTQEKIINNAEPTRPPVRDRPLISAPTPFPQAPPIQSGGLMPDGGPTNEIAAGFDLQNRDESAATTMTTTTMMMTSSTFKCILALLIVYLFNP